MITRVSRDMTLRKSGITKTSGMMLRFFILNRNNRQPVAPDNNHRRYNHYHFGRTQKDPLFMPQNVRYELYRLENFFAAGLVGVSEPRMEGYHSLGKTATIKKEIARIKRSIIEKVFTLKDEALVRRYIGFHQRGIVSVMDDVSSRCGSTAAPCHYKDLEDMLLFLEKNFEKYIDVDAKVPDLWVTRFKHEVGGNLPILEPRLHEGTANRETIEVLLRPLKTLSAPETSEAVTYRRLRYLRQLQKQLSKVAGPACTDENLRLLMYNMNHNGTKGIARLKDEIMNTIEKCDTVSEKIERLSFFLKEVNQAPVRCETSYHPDSPPIKSQVTAFLTEEIAYLQRFSNVARIPGDSHGNTFQEIKLKLDMSVSQLGYALKLLVDTNVIQNENTAALLRFAAGSCTTKRSEVVSAGSLRAKFYEVEHATRESVKQMLLNIVAHIDRRS